MAGSVDSGGAAGVQLTPSELRSAGRQWEAREGLEEHVKARCPEDSVLAELGGVGLWTGGQTGREQMVEGGRPRREVGPGEGPRGGTQQEAKSPGCALEAPSFDVPTMSGPVAAASHPCPCLILKLSWGAGMTYPFSRQGSRGTRGEGACLGWPGAAELDPGPEPSAKPTCQGWRREERGGECLQPPP